MPTVNLIYRLSPEGRKSALLAGEPATADATRQVEVDSLVPYADAIRVDTRGNAEINSTDYIDTFDATPSVDECVDAIRVAKTELVARKKAYIAKQDADTAARATAKAAARESWTRAFLKNWSGEMLQRFDAELLPDSELESAVRDYAFSPLNPAAAYEKLRDGDLDCDCGLGYDSQPSVAAFRSFPAESATAGEFAALETMRSAVAANDRLEQAEVTLRTHVAECECGAKATRTGILVVANCGPFPVRMEFAAE